MLSMMSCPPVLMWLPSPLWPRSKRALAQMRLSGAPIQTNLQRSGFALAAALRRWTPSSMRCLNAKPLQPSGRATGMN